MSWSTINTTKLDAGLALRASCGGRVFSFNGPGGAALREGEQLIDRPLVVGVGTVLYRVDPSGRRDQEVGRQAQGATHGKPQAEMTMRHTAHRRAESSKAQEAQRAFNPEAPVKSFLWIAD